MSEPRKATDVLLDLESKISTLLGIVRAQDLNIKVLSNKLNDVIGRLDKQQAGPPKIIVETVQSPHPQLAVMPPGFTQLPAGDPDRTIPFASETNLPQSNEPQGFRRNSRPETYVNAPEEMRMQIPRTPPSPPGRQSANAPPPGRGPGSEVTSIASNAGNAQIFKGKGGVIMAPPQPSKPQQPTTPPGEELHFPPFGEQGNIPVSQRCVDKNGKSIFLASVSIVDSNNQPVFQTRTSGTGKWTAPLAVGAYRVTVHKQGSSIRDKIEAVQDIEVDGLKSPLELPMMIIK